MTKCPLSTTIFYLPEKLKKHVIPGFWRNVKKYIYSCINFWFSSTNTVKVQRFTFPEYTNVNYVSDAK